MSNIHASINVWDKYGHFHQIFDVKFVRYFNPTKNERESSINLVKSLYPNYKRAELVVMHYDKNDYNDKNNLVEL